MSIGDVCNSGGWSESKRKKENFPQLTKTKQLACQDLGTNADKMVHNLP